MLTAIRINGFKSFEHVELKLGALNLFIGTNSSGKSNFLDALRVLQGIGNGFTVDEILNGKAQRANCEIWEGIRGGGREAAFLRRGSARQTRDEGHFELGVDAAWQVEGSDSMSQVTYDVSLAPGVGWVSREFLSHDGRTIFTSEWSPPGRVLRGQVTDAEGGAARLFEVELSRPALGQLIHDKAIVGSDAQRMYDLLAGLANAQRFEFAPSVLREYGRLQHVRHMGERGENFAALVATILQHPKTGDAYVAWLRKFAPVPVEGVVIAHGAAGEPLFSLNEGGTRFLAHVLSDGMLRFAALAATFYQPDMPSLVTFEEIENGLHPSRLPLLVELLRSQTQRTGTQVFATTNSPSVVALLEEAEYATTFLCRRDAASGASQVVPLSEVPHLVEAAQKAAARDVFVESWMQSS